MTLRTILLLLLLGTAVFAAKPTDYSTDMVMIQNGKVMETLKLYVSAQKSRLEGMTAGPLGRTDAISRKDRGVTWTLYPDRKQYVESALNAGNQVNKNDLSSLDLASVKKENLGRENVLGYSCTKMRVTLGNLPNGQPLVATVWVADSLDLPVRLETMGIIQENRNIRIGPQAASLFEIPAGYTKSTAPGMPTGGGISSSTGRIAASTAGKTAGTTAGNLATQATDKLGAAAMSQIDAVAARYGGKGVSSAGSQSSGGAVAGQAASSQTSQSGFEQNVNRNGEDYRDFLPSSADPALCAAACTGEARCRSWTWVKAELEGPTGHCWLKNRVPEPAQDDCCVSGLKGATGSTSQTTSRYRLEQNVNRNGEDYRDFIPARASADVCAEACAKESRCRSWTWVKAELEGPTGHCWLKNGVPEPAQDDCCVSGLRQR